MGLSYENRFGDRYYLHGKPRTKKGGTRYVMARAVGDGALDELPEGLEIRESVNGQVSVAKIVPQPIRTEEERLVLAALRGIPRLGFHTAAVEGESIIVHEPVGDVEMLAALRAMGRSHQPRYAPVLRFDLTDVDARRFTARRKTYRGEGGWSWPLESGKLAQLAKKLIPKLGTDDFFELM